MADATFKLPQLAIQAIQITVVGDSPLITHKWSEKDAELRDQVVRTAWKELMAFRQKYEGLAQLAKIFAAMDEARPAIEK